MRKLIVWTLIIVCFLFSYLFFRSTFTWSKKKEIYAIPTVTPIIEIADRTLWSLIQDWRKNNGLRPYIEDQRLCDIAKDRSNDAYTHQGLYDKYSGYPYVISENMVKLGFPRDMLIAWLNSSAHLVNLEKPYIYSCVICDKQCVQIFSSFKTDRNNPY